MKHLLMVITTTLAFLTFTACSGDGIDTSLQVNENIASAEKNRESFRVLVFHRAESFFHYSIPLGLAMIKTLGRENDFEVDTSTNPNIFTDENLAQYQAVVWLNTTGKVIDTDEQRRSIEKYMSNGGGYVGIHSAADAEYEWPFYERMVGAYFKSHGIQQFGTIVNEDNLQPSTAHLPDRWSIFEEFYSFRSNPRNQVNVLLSIDESTYSPDPNTSNLPGSPTFPFGETGVMGDHPMSWCHTNVGGISWYTALGHEGYLYFLPKFKTHVLNGILTAAGQVKADCETR